jgi:hypothetical protein
MLFVLSMLSRRFAHPSPPNGEPRRYSAHRERDNPRDNG